MIKDGLASAVHWSGLGRLVLSGADLTGLRVPVLLYHGVAERPGPDQAGRAAFAAQMAYLSQRYTVVPLSLAVEAVRAGHKGPTDWAVVTFDDGYRNLLANAFPVLQEHRIPATVFAVPGFAGAQAVWSSADPESRRLLGWGEMQELSRAGLEFGSHTLTHADLLNLPPATVRAELAASKDALEQRLGVPVRDLAYPWCRFDERTVDIAREVGYTSACAGGWWMHHLLRRLMTMKRVPVYPGDSLEVFRRKLEGAYCYMNIGATSRDRRRAPPAAGNAE